MKKTETKSTAEAKEILKKSGLKSTGARLEILGLFSDKCHPLSAEDVHEKLIQGRNGKDSADLVTVYRTLTSFEKAGIIRRIDLHKGSQMYELRSHHHHHIVCTGCGLVEKLDECSMDKIAEKAVTKSSNFRIIQDHSLELFGLCRKCA